MAAGLSISEQLVLGNAPSRTPSTAQVTRATSEIVLAALGFGAISILTVVATQRGGATLLSVLSWRYLLATIALIVLSRGVAQLRIPRRRALAILLLGGGGQTLIALLALSALRFIPASTLGFLFYTFPAWVALFGILRRTERLDVRRGVSLLLALAGIVVMVGVPSNTAGSLTGVVMALASAVAYALYIPLLEQLQKGITPVAASAYVCAGAAFILVITSVTTGAFQIGMSVTAWGAILGLALVSTTAAFILFLRGLATLGPLRSAIISTVEPFFTAVLAAVVLSQPLTPATFAGGAMVATAVVLLALTRNPVAITADSQ
ncbi:MAG: DMT family transporter [Gemmatimonadota bacterium]|nr:DMT family transporter [Gemmatimonadota bacterium]